MPVRTPVEIRTNFAEAADQRRRSMQAALVELLTSVGLSGARPVEVGRRLGLDKTLAWKISRVAQSADPADAFRHLPGPAGVEIVLRAALERRVGAEVLERVRRAYDDVRAFVEEHAGDRRSFEAMLSGHAASAATELDERRAYFRSGSALWGVRARLQFLMLALRPSPGLEGQIDVLQVGGLVNLERLRADVPWIVRRLRAHTDTGASLTPSRRMALMEPRRVPGSTPLFDPFCTQPLPEVRQFEGSDGWVYDELAPGTVGRGGAVTVVLGETYGGALPLERSEDNTRGDYLLTVRTPVECVLFDLLLHRDLAHFGRPMRHVRGLLEGRPSRPPLSGAGRGAGLMASSDAVDLGSSAVMHTHRLPGYPEMVGRALEMGGFGDASGYRGYRAEVEFPAFPCDVCLSLEIGERAAAARPT